jgi:ribonucleoside-triphosphate reductase
MLICCPMQAVHYRLFWKVFRKGDATGRPFVFPRPLIHLTESFFDDPRGGRFWNRLPRQPLRRETPVLSLTGFASVSFWSGISGTLSGGKASRSFLLHNVTINLPRLGYLAGGDDNRLFELLGDRVDLAAQAHLQKKRYLESLIGLGDEGPLATLVMAMDGEPFMDLARSASLVGMVGLHELVLLHRGEGLNGSDHAGNSAWRWCAG